MLKNLSKQVIAGIAALSLTLSSATPGFADSLDREDVGKLLFGLAAIAVLGAAIENNADRDNGAVPTGRQQVAGGGHDWAGLNRPRVRDHDVRRHLPLTCLQRVETRQGSLQIFDKHCLDQTYRHASRLPDRCAVRLLSTAGPVRGFDPYCLRDQGFRATRYH